MQDNSEDLLDEDVYYKVESVMDKKIMDEKVYYLIKWLDWPDEFNSWE